MTNTLSNLALLQSKRFAYQHARDVMDNVAREARIYGEFLSAVFSETAFKSEADRLDREMKNNEIAHEVASREWELAESYLRIYQVQVSKFYEFLTSQPNDFLPENTVGGLEKAKNESSIECAAFTRMEREARQAYERDKNSAEYPSSFHSPIDEALGEVEKRRQVWFEKGKIIKRGELEWKAVKDFVKAQDWTASEYVAKIKEFVDK